MGIGCVYPRNGYNAQRRVRFHSWFSDRQGIADRGAGSGRMKPVFRLWVSLKSSSYPFAAVPNAHQRVAPSLGMAQQRLT
jgi:hypothetical protein